MKFSKVCAGLSLAVNGALDSSAAAGAPDARAAAALAPERFSFNVARLAMTLNRPREAIEVLNTIDPNSPHAGGPGAYWDLVTFCYHALGDGDRELEAARAARRSNIEAMSALSLEIRALASLGRVDAIRALLDTALASPVDQGPTPHQLMVGIARISSAGQLMAMAAQELRAHGHEDAARESLGRALAWYRRQPAAVAATERHRIEVARTLYLARDWSAADSAFAVLAASDTTSASNYLYLGFRGTIAARRGDEETARGVIARFDTLRTTLPQPRAISGFWQAKISALLGDDQRALTLMSQIYGPQGHHGAHTDFDYERLWGSPEFLTFIRPKG